VRRDPSAVDQLVPLHGPVGEGDDGELDPQAFAELIVHGYGDLQMRSARRFVPRQANRFYFMPARSAVIQGISLH